MNIFKDINVHMYSRAKDWSGSILGLLIMIFTFLMSIFIYYPYRQVFEMDPDEGINLIKALLVEQGYSLYSEIWSDQPPIFTYLLAIVFRILGNNVNAGRTLVLFISCVLLIGYFIYLRMVWGNKHALAGTLILIMLPTYLGLSVSIMIGLPAIAFAVLSLLTLTAWHQRRKYVWLVLSAIALCLSVFIKIFTGILVPVFVTGLLIDEYRRLGGTGHWRQALRPAIIWVIIFGGIATILGLVFIGPQNVWQMLAPHLAASKVSSYQEDIRTYSINVHLRGSWTILLLALMGSFFVLNKRRWLSLYLIAWIVLGYIFLTQNTPARDHHQLLITIPAAMLAGIAIGEVADMIPALIKSRNFFNYKTLVSAIVLVALVLTIMIRVPWIVQHPNRIRTITEPQIRYLQKIYSFAPQTNWIITDEPMYAFRTVLPIPPPIAVITRKRLDTGYLTEDQIIDAVREWKPEQVLLGRFNFPDLEKYLEEDYRLIHSRIHMKLYVRKDL